MREARGVLHRNPLKGVAPGAQGRRTKEPTPHCVLACGARSPKPAAASRARRPPAGPGAQRTRLSGSHVTLPRPWGSPRRRHPFPHIRRTARPPPATANGAPRSAPRDLRAHPRPPISARQATPAAPLAAMPARQPPVPPTSPGQFHSILLHSLSPRGRRQRDRGGFALCRDSRPLPDGSGASIPSRDGGSARLPVSGSAPPD